MSVKIPPWSYSSLSAYESCPRKYYYTRVAEGQRIQEPPTEHTIWGNRVHQALEDRVAKKTPLPEGMQQWEGIAAKFDGVKGKVFTETRFALTRNLTPTKWTDPSCWVRGIIDLGIDKGDKATLLDWKGLAVNTKIPTPEGFAAMGDIRVGDIVFASTGEQCAVVGVSQEKNIPCYEVAFDDTSSVICDEEHLWKLHDGTVVPVTELCFGDKVEVAQPLSISDRTLPIDPYVLGLWLADGKHTSGEISKPDQFVWDEVARRGFELSHDYSEKAGDGKCCTRTVKGLRGKLREANLLGNKHIPTAYLRAGYQQRLDLLRGLMDGDGSANPHRKQAIFTSTDKQLSDSVIELLCSLGQRPLQSEVTAHGFGKSVLAYPVSFRPMGINPFSLPRKADQIQAAWGSGNSWRRKVISVRPVPSVTTKCISVDSPDSTFLCTEKMIPTHNTGKVKHEIAQLKLFTGLFMQTYPRVEEVRTGFIWLAHDKMTREDYNRDHLPEIWEDFISRSERLANAYKTNKWIPNPSGLCRGWCPVGPELCEFWKPKKGG